MLGSGGTVDCVGELRVLVRMGIFIGLNSVREASIRIC